MKKLMVNIKKEGSTISDKGIQKIQFIGKYREFMLYL